MEFWVLTVTLTAGTTMATTQSSALRAGLTWSPRCSIVLEPEWTSSYWMRTERTGHLKTSKDPTGNQTRDFPIVVQCLNQLREGWGECSMHKNLRFEELQKNCSLISGKGRDNSVLHCVSISPRPHASSSSFSARTSGTKREKRETEQTSSEVKKPALTYLFSIYVLTSRCLCKHTA